MLPETAPPGRMQGERPKNKPDFSRLDVVVKKAKELR